MLFQEILFLRRYVSDIVQNVSFATIFITRVSEGVLGKGSKQKKYRAREHVRSSSDPPAPQAVRDALFDH